MGHAVVHLCMNARSETFFASQSLLFLDWATFYRDKWLSFSYENKAMQNRKSLPASLLQLGKQFMLKVLHQHRSRSLLPQQ